MPSDKKTLRATIYARYSSDNQRESSIEDQIEVRRRYAELKGWTIVKVYAEHAQSGASRFRSEFQQMQVDAEGGCFDVIIIEALDRLSRKLADVADLHDRPRFLGHQAARGLHGRGHRHARRHAGDYGPDVPQGPRREGRAGSAGSGAQGEDRRGADLP